MRQDDRFLMPCLPIGWWQCLAWLFVIPTANALPLEPLACPPGTTYRAPEDFSAARQSETCVDVLGRMEGPFRVWRARNGMLKMQGFFRDGVLDDVLRYYEEKGELFEESLYARGALISRTSALLSLDRLIEEVNAQAQASGENWTAHVVNGESLGFDYPISTPLAYFIMWISADDFAARSKKMALSNPEFCSGIRRMSHEVSGPILRIRMRWLTAGGKLVAEIWIRADDCAEISPADS